MARSRVYRFGPGLLEDCELRLWARPRTEGRIIVAELRGPVFVYCGNGQTHVARLNYRTEAMRDDWETILARYGATIAQTSEDALTARVYGADPDDRQWLAEELAYTLHGNALEDWEDPCMSECAECGAPAVNYGDGEWEQWCTAHTPADWETGQ